jgi:hypothetical protein
MPRQFGLLQEIFQPDMRLPTRHQTMHNRHMPVRPVSIGKLSRHIQVLVFWWQTNQWFQLPMAVKRFS